MLHLFGSPDRDRLSVLRDLTASTNRALKERTLDPGRLREHLTASGWTDTLARARRALQDRLAADTEPAPVPAPDLDDTTTTEAAAPAPPQLEQKDVEQMTLAEDTTAPASTTKDGFLRALEASAGADRTCKKHEAVRHALKSDLLWADLQPTDSPLVDVSCVTGRGLFLYEALGAGRSAYADLRSGATRLLEINHTLTPRADGLYLVLSEPPAEDWSADTVRDVFGVHVIWRSPEGWGGTDTDIALGQRPQS